MNVKNAWREGERLEGKEASFGTIGLLFWQNDTNGKSNIPLEVIGSLKEGSVVSVVGSWSPEYKCVWATDINDEDSDEDDSDDNSNYLEF
jgi:hypothetical protein